MSADRYSICPQCVADQIFEAACAEKILPEAYGKVTPDVYLFLVETANRQYKNRAEMPENLREDYYVGVNHNGKFVVNYVCECSVCGFTYSHVSPGIDILKTPNTPEWLADVNKAIKKRKK